MNFMIFGLSSSRLVVFARSVWSAVFFSFLFLSARSSRWVRSLGALPSVPFAPNLIGRRRRRLPNLHWPHFRIDGANIESVGVAFTGLYWVLLGFTGFYWVLPSFTGFFMDSIELYRCLLGFT